MDPIIQLQGLSKNYGKIKAVENLNLDIQKGEIFGLLGPNGAGKTTTILMMLGLSEPTAGKAFVCGYNATQNPIAVKRKVGYMPDSVGFYDGLTALENLTYIGKLNGLSEIASKASAQELLEIVGLKNDMHKKAGAFSRGMKQRLGLADVLIKQPEVIILDEPTLGIDPQGVKEFLILIKQLSQQKGLTVLLSSHHLNHVQQVCDRVGIFVSGKLLAMGNMDTLSGNLFHQDGYVTAITLNQHVMQPWIHQAELSAWQSVNQITVNDKVIEIGCKTDVTPDLVRFFVEKGYAVMGVHKKEYGLEDIYQKYFENDPEDENQAAKATNAGKKSFFKKYNK